MQIADALEPGRLSFNINAVSDTEGGAVTLTVQLTVGTDGEVSVRAHSVNGTAIAGTGFTALDQLLTIPAGQSSATLTLNTANRSGSQGARTFDVELLSPTGGAQLAAVSLSSSP